MAQRNRSRLIEFVKGYIEEEEIRRSIHRVEDGEEPRDLRDIIADALDAFEGGEAEHGERYSIVVTSKGD